MCITVCKVSAGGIWLLCYMLLGSSSGSEKTLLQYVPAFPPLLFNDRLNLGGVDGSDSSSGIKKLQLVQIQASLIVTKSYYPGFGICVEQMYVSQTSSKQPNIS